MVDKVGAAYSISHGLLIEHYMHLPHVASKSEQSLLPKVKRSVVVAKNREHPFEGPREVLEILPVAVGLLWLEHSVLASGGLATSHLKIFKVREAFS
jgi:hypothetical protein